MDAFEEHCYLKRHENPLRWLGLAGEILNQLGGGNDDAKANICKTIGSLQYGYFIIAGFLISPLISLQSSFTAMTEILQSIFDIYHWLFRRDLFPRDLVYLINFTVINGIIFNLYLLLLFAFVYYAVVQQVKKIFRTKV